MMELIASVRMSERHSSPVSHAIMTANEASGDLSPSGICTAFCADYINYLKIHERIIYAMA